MKVTFKCSCGRTFNSKQEVNAHAKQANSRLRPREPEHEGAIYIQPQDGDERFR